jgi:hypothetical protein
MRGEKRAAFGARRGAADERVKSRLCERIANRLMARAPLRVPFGRLMRAEGVAVKKDRRHRGLSWIGNADRV